MDVEKTKKDIIEAGKKAIQELIKVAESKILNEGGDDIMAEDLSADKLKNAAATKKLAIFDAFEILERISEEEANIEADLSTDTKDFRGFVEKRSKDAKK